MKNPETYLAADLLAALQNKKTIPSLRLPDGSKLAPEYWRAYLGDHATPRQGSENWPLLAGGIWAVVAILQRKTSLADRAACIEWWRQEIIYQRGKWMGIELLSRIYMELIVAGVLAAEWAMARSPMVVLGAADVLADLWSWLRCFWGACGLGAARTASGHPVVTATGFRSWAIAKDGDGQRVGEPHHIAGHPIDKVLEWASGKASPTGSEWLWQVVRLVSTEGGGLTTAERNALAAHLRGDFCAGTLAGWLDGWAPAVEVQLAQTTTGDGATVTTRSGGQSTDPLLALVGRGEGNLEPLGVYDALREHGTPIAKGEAGIEPDGAVWAQQEGDARPGLVEKSTRLRGPLVHLTTWNRAGVRQDNGAGNQEPKPPGPPPPGKPPAATMEQLRAHSRRLAGLIEDLDAGADPVAVAVQIDNVANALQQRAQELQELRNG